jgi:hypothetical protein
MSGSPVLTRVHLDGNGQDLAVEHWQDCEDILERNKALRSMPQKSDFGRHIASIPNVIIVQWMNEEHARGHNVMPFTKEFDEIIARKLRDPEWAYLRTDNADVQGFMGFGS